MLKPYAFMCCGKDGGFDRDGVRGPFDTGHIPVERVPKKKTNKAKFVKLKIITDSICIPSLLSSSFRVKRNMYNTQALALWI